jgi:ubiquinone/menaquinone biosynthesis C-methylase UbiE
LIFRGDKLQRARRRATKHRLNNVEALLEMDGGAMTFSDNHFDAVLATFVLSVAPNPA